jgi:hypothetical protein
VAFFSKDPLLPRKLVGRRPVRNVVGIWELEFGDGRVVPSVRNCILTTEDNDVGYILVRKVAKNEMAIEAAPMVRPICIFGIVLALYQTKL